MKVNIGPYPKHKSKAKRRVSVKIDDYDIWSLDHTLALVILPALKLIKKQKHGGAPGSIFDYSHHKMKDWASKEFKAADKKSSAEGFKKWDTILDDMIYSFREAANDTDGIVRFSTKKNGFDKKAYLAYEKKVARGFELFGKYYQALWT